MVATEGEEYGSTTLITLTSSPRRAKEAQAAANRLEKDRARVDQPGSRNQGIYLVLEHLLWGSRWQPVWLKHSPREEVQWKTSLCLWRPSCLMEEPP